MFGTSNSDNAQGTSILAIHLDETALHLLRRVIASVPGFTFGASLQHYFGEKDATLIRTMREIHPEVCVIDLDRDRQMALETVEYLRRSSLSSIAIFAVSSRMDSESIIGAMRSGCTEYLEKPLVADRVQEALVQLSRKKRDSLVSAVQGKLITLMGVKGGVGATTLAVHLAYSLAKRGKKVILVDHHPELGEATLHLGLEHHNYGFYELACNLNRMDAELLQGFALKHESGLEVLASPEALGMTPKTTPEAVQQTLRFLLRIYDYVIVDTACGFDEQNLAILEASDEFNLIATPQLPSIRSTSRFLDYLLRLNYSTSKAQVILNRWTKRAPLSVENIEKALHRKIALIIPNSESELTEAIATGVPVSVKSRSDFMQGINKWTLRLNGSLEITSDDGPEKRIHEARSRFNVLGISG
ncbi:MAG TPA: AAA family ATPase [Edaphobacter sp.]|jgi:pilus assembly protein CpaE|nr:AAA family ATPase [Edaphobacter sp.]